MIYYKDRHIKANQAKILAKLQDSKKKFLFYRYDKTDPDWAFALLFRRINL